MRVFAESVVLKFEPAFSFRSNLFMPPKMYGISLSIAILHICYEIVVPERVLSFPGR